VLHGLGVQPIGQVLQQGLGRGRLGRHFQLHRLVEANQPGLALQQLEPGPHRTDPMAVVGGGQHRRQAAPQLLQLQQVLGPNLLGFEGDRAGQLIEPSLYNSPDGLFTAADTISNRLVGLAQGPKPHDLRVSLSAGQSGFLG